MNIAPVTCPAQYARWIQSAIAVAIRDAQRDAAVRAGAPAPAGYRPLPDSFLDFNATGDVVVAVIPIPAEAPQLRDAEWPDAPAPSVMRFPKFANRNTPVTRNVAHGSAVRPLNTGTDR